MALVGAMSFLGFAIGLMGGVEWAKPSRPAATSVDVGFLQDMSSHHEQAIQMSLLEMRRGQLIFRVRSIGAIYLQKTLLREMRVLSAERD